MPLGYSLNDEPWESAMVRLPRDGKLASAEEAAKRLGLAPVLKRFGSWAVTTHGVECLVMPYDIPKGRLWQSWPAYPWERHLSTKRWVTGDDAVAALAYARTLWPRKEPTTTATVEGGLARIGGR